MKKFKPTTPSRRHMTTVDYSVLSRVKPDKALTKRVKTTGARNSQGRITTRHRGGGNKRLYREVDFSRMSAKDIPGRVETLEYDPYRTGFIAKVVYQNGARSYILASSGMKVGDSILTAEKTPLTEGNRLLLKNIPVGYEVYNVELRPGKGGQMVKSAGASAQVLAHDAGFTTLKMPSKEVRRVSWDGLASLGKVSNSDHSLVTIGKAGRTRWLRRRPVVRGTAMNPVDHKYGGGEGRQPRGTKRPKDIWGNITGGRKTRKKNKWSNKFIVSRRKTKR